MLIVVTLTHIWTVFKLNVHKDCKVYLIHFISSKLNIKYHKKIVCIIFKWKYKKCLIEN